MGGKRMTRGGVEDEEKRGERKGGENKCICWCWGMGTLGICRLCSALLCSALYNMNVLVRYYKS